MVELTAQLNMVALICGFLIFFIERYIKSCMYIWHEQRSKVVQGKRGTNRKEKG